MEYNEVQLILAHITEMRQESRERDVRDDERNQEITTLLTQHQSILDFYFKNNGTPSKYNQLVRDVYDLKKDRWRFAGFVAGELCW